MKLIIFNLTTLLLGLLVGSSFASNCEGAFATIARPSKPVSNKTNLRSSVGPGNLASRKLIRDREEDKKAAKAQHMKTSRIIGGNTVTDPDAYHYFAQWDVGCGATMIAPDMLLSAASCSNDTFARTVWIGGHDYQIGVRRTIVKRQKHPSYVSGSFDYDFVVLKLNEPITEITWPILADISPVELAQEGEEKEAGEEVTLIGFGPTTAGGYGSKTLQEATVELLPNEACEGTANALCVNDDGKSACMSDVGGPVLDATSGKQIGIVSGETCSDPIYLKVNTVYDWIREQICCMAESPPDKCDPCPTSFSGVGDISLKLTVELDDYPEETAISFQNIDTGDELLFFEHGDLINEKSVSETVRNIGPGKYRLLLNDIYGDGISSGSITLSKANGGELWSHSGRFEDTLEATFTLDPEGSVLAMEVEPPEEDVPNFHGDHSLTIDITFDEKPAETTIQLVHYDSFASVGILHGADYEANARASITYHDLPSGTYTLTVRDDGEDGTGQLEVRDENDEVLYNSDGKFSDYLTVDIKVD